MKNLTTAFENSIRPFYQPIKQAAQAKKEGRPKDFIPAVEPSASDRQFPLEQALELQKQGKTIWQISKIIRFDRRTTRKYLQLGCIPEHGNHRNFRASKVAAYEHIIQQELALSRVNISRLHLNMQRAGFVGSRNTVRSYMLSRYPEIEGRRKKVGVVSKPVSAFQPITYKKLVWLLLNFSEERSVDDLALLETIQKDVPGLWNLRDLLRVGLDAFRERDLPVFLSWVETVLASDYSELKGYIGGLKKDWDAVLNSFKYAYSNGPVESQVNRLKCIKRQMYGRAKFDLLRLKVLFKPGAISSFRTESQSCCDSSCG
ncbi:hypothetical protein GCM10008938_36990 [Deinococcus roseus]|uniref:Transposase IS204/IS1001/IS1096/IS1165 DDE domain-containing protein n=1 Tax=Deinococcus roseus TaxID=392414 RepID=A0ABQ2D6H3_9DEIO|nr:transposase [Deinococcus roseus]GGJ47599.1 hypothetical protein GCM10008938_36990 [Deinococcus roseus]